MLHIDLVTGFLGAGKTTFIKKYTDYLKSRGEKVLVIENEFGMVNVDAKILRGSDLSVDDLTGCCMCCTGRDRFIEMLISGSSRGYDRIIVEPSGIYDVDEFFSVCAVSEVRATCSIGNIFTVIDACDPVPQTAEGRYLLYCQILASGRVLLSKTDVPGAFDMDTIGSRIKSLTDDFNIECDEGLIYPKGICSFTDEDYDMILDSGFREISHARQKMDHGEIFEVCEAVARVKSEDDLKDRIREVFDDPACGKVMRIKGTAMLPDKKYCMVNAVGSVVSIDCNAKGKGLLVAIGQDLDRDRICGIFGR